MPKKYKTGIALSGGGARGIAHLGVLKALYEKGILPDIISGVSAGAIVGSFIADGLGPDDVFKLIKDKKLFHFSKVHLPTNGLLNLNGLKDILEEEINSDKLEEMKIPVIIGATNMTLGKMEYFREGPVNKIVLASAAIPILFAPVKIGDYLYSDGGIFDNLPVTPLCDICEKVIAIHVNPYHRNDNLNSLIKMATRTFLLNVNETIKGSRDKCNLFIEPDTLDQYEILGVNKADELFDVGYKYTLDMDINL